MLKSLTNIANSIKDLFLTKKEAASAKRRGDFIIIVCHRIDQKKLEIQAVDSEMERVTGYSAEYLTRRELKHILPAYINDFINDYMEDSQNNDLVSEIKKVRDFALISKDGREVPVSLKILETTPLDSNPRYCLMMREVGLLKALNASRDQLFKELSLSQIMDDSVGLISKESFLQNLELICFFIERTAAKASFALIKINNLQANEKNISSNTGNNIIHDIGKICEANFRQEDMVGYLGGNKIGAILFDTTAENSEIPLNRLRWSINAKGFISENKTQLKLTSIISYLDIKKGQKPSELIENCDKAIDENMDQNKGLIRVI